MAVSAAHCMGVICASMRYLPVTSEQTLACHLQQSCVLLTWSCWLQVGEFQCYDRRALASLAQAARDAGQPDWGYGGPHDAGSYNSTPEVCLG